MSSYRVVNLLKGKGIQKKLPVFYNGFQTSAAMNARRFKHLIMEPIGRAPYLKKWVRYDSPILSHKKEDTASEQRVDDFFKYLLDQLGICNLELLYRLRHTVELAGREPFIRRMYQFDKSLRRAVNTSYDSLEKLLDEILAEAELYGMEKRQKHERFYSAQEADNYDIAGHELYDIPDADDSEEVQYEPECGYAYGWLDKYARSSSSSPDRLTREVEARQDFHKFNLPLKRDAEESEEDGEAPEEPFETPFLRRYKDFGFREKDASLETDFADTEKLSEGDPKHTDSPAHSGDRESSEERAADKPRLPMPPPLYKFKFEFKRQIEADSADTEKNSDPLVIDSDCINRRISTFHEKVDFLQGSAFWDAFRKRGERQNMHPDATSLIVNQESILHRIVNLKPATRHALEWHPEEEKAFIAFDTTFEGNSAEKEESASRSESGTDPTSKPGINPDLMDQLYDRSIRQLQDKDEVLHDWLSGKIAIDETDKYEMERWLRNQSSSPTDIYRAYSEAIMNTKSSNLKDIQKAVKKMIPPENFPSRRIKRIFNRIRRESNIASVNYKDIVNMLQRQRFLSEAPQPDASRLSFSEAYASLRDWRTFIDSPKIEVRLPEVYKPGSFLPVRGYSRKWNFPDSPDIKVRTSSDYMRQHAISVLDKIHNWRKSLKAPDDKNKPSE